MTLVVGIISKDGIVMAADSRMTDSLTTNDTIDKLFKLGNNGAVGVSGDGTLGLHFLKLISDDLSKQSGIVELVEEFRSKGKDKFNDYYSHIVDPKERPKLTFMIAGYDKSTQEPMLYELSSRDNFIPRPSSTGFNCIGMRFLSEYILNRFYEKEITIEQAEILAAFCVMETESQSHEVGGDLKIASFSLTKEYSTLSSQKLDEIKQKTSGFHSGNKAKFYPEEYPK